MAEEGSGRLNSGDGRVNDENIDKRADGVQRASGNDTARRVAARRGALTLESYVAAFPSAPIEMFPSGVHRAARGSGSKTEFDFLKT